MGNEFGHPEWVDFPREENDWSYRYARRQWHLVDDYRLKYHYLGQFDRDMLRLSKAFRVLVAPEIILLHEHSDNKVIVFQRAGLLFAFNFHPTRSYSDYTISAEPGKYRLIFDSDRPEYGGHGRLTPHQEHLTLSGLEENVQTERLSLYLPTRTAIVLKRVD